MGYYSQVSETITLLEIDMSEIKELREKIVELEEELEELEFGSYSYDVVSSELMFAEWDLEKLEKKEI